MESQRARPIARWALPVGAAIVAALSPLLFTGPGSDLDTGAVIQSGRAILRGDYLPSRPPGAPVHEAAVGVLERVGGTALANAGSLAAAIVLVVALAVFLRGERVPRPELAAAVVVANPWFQIAATSVVDFAWAMGFALGGLVLLRRQHPIWAGLLFGVAIGCRMSTAIIVFAALVAVLLEGRRFEERRGVLVAGALAAVTAALIYLPPFFAAGSSLAFANNDFRSASPFNLIGRALAKDFYFVGPFAAIALALSVPAIVRVLPEWRTSYALRFALIGLVGSQILFLRFPWKMGHLIPSLVCLAVVLAVALARHPKLLAAIVALELLFGVVNIELFQPNTPNSATSAELKFDVRWGPLIIDTQCRRQDEHAWVDNNQARLEAVWNCAKPWGEGP